MHRWDLDTPDFGALIGVVLIATGLAYRFGADIALIFLGVVLVLYAVLIAYFEQRPEPTT